MLFSVGHAQGDKFFINGKFKVDGGSNSGAKIIVEKDGKRVKQIEGDSRFKIGLDFQAIYVISFEKEGFVTKRLRFDTHVPNERIEYGFEPFPFTVEIFEQYDDINMVIFNQPVGRISYSELIDEFDYDTDYTKSIQAQVEKAMEEVEVAKEKKVQKEAENAGKISDLSKTAESSAKSGNFEQAIKSYEEALALKKDPAIEQRINELKKEAEGQKKEQEFNKTVEQAEQAMAKGDMDEAKRLFQQANGMMAGDSKVQKALAQIEEEKKKQTLQAQAFDNAVKAAETALSSGNPDQAIAKAEEALKIKADPKAEKILADATKAKQAAEAEAKAAAELDEKVASLLADASKAKDKGDFGAALAALEEAKQLKADPSIDQQIKSVNDAKAQMKAEQQKQEEAKAALTAALDEAEKLLANGDIAGAKAKLAAAGELGQDDRLKSIASAIETEEKRVQAEQAEQAKKQGQIASLLADASSLLGEGKLDEAAAKANEAKSAGAEASKVDAILSQVQSKRDELAAAEAAKAKEQAAKLAQLDEKISAAQQALVSGDLAGAKAALTAASALGSDPRIKDIQKEIDTKEKELVSAAEAEAKTKERYNELIAEGNEALSAKELTKAEKAFNEAKSLVDDPKEAMDGLASVTAIRSELSELQRQEEAAAAAAAEAKRKAEEEAAAKAERQAIEREQEIASKLSAAEALFNANKLKQAKSAYQGVLSLDANSTEAKNRIEQIDDILSKLEAEKEKNKEAAIAITDQRGRESEQLARIIEEEEVKVAKNPSIAEPTPNANPSGGVKQAQAVMEVDERPGAPVGPITISDDKVGDDARNTKTGRLTEDELYDGMMKRTEQQISEFQASEEMKALMSKYPDVRTVETETVGNSVITWVYINNGEFIVTYKKVQHNWGGVYFFVAGQPTNQRYWEHQTKE